ncbi:MAG TPA: hypothetical protein VIF09_23190 [Polyangiaceae bacterium]
MRLALSALVFVSMAAACSSLTEDAAVPPPADPLGTGVRIASIQNPSSPDYTQAVANPTLGVKVDVSSVVVSWIDTFDETKDGKSIGTVYIQDVGSQAPYSGISLYEPSYVPASLRLLPGDVLDVAGPYEEVPKIGTAVFNTGNSLPQLAKPVGTFRYEFSTPSPVEVQLSDINQNNYSTGRKWEGMLVTLKDITIANCTSDTAGLRNVCLMGQGDASIDLHAAAISNEFYDLKITDYPGGTHFSSVTGIVTWFYSYEVAPRSPADLVVGP